MSSDAERRRKTLLGIVDAFNKTEATTLSYGVETRWFTELDEWERFMALWPAVASMIKSGDFDDFIDTEDIPSDIELTIVRQLIDLLKPFKAV